jgi:hypothetical protein
VSQNPAFNYGVIYQLPAPILARTNRKYPPIALDECPWLLDEISAQVDYPKCTPGIEKADSPESAMSNK